MTLLARLKRFWATGTWGPEDDRWYSPGGAFYGGTALSAAGAIVDPDSALRLLTVQNCVRVRAFTIGQLPCHLMERSGRAKRPALDSPLYELLHDQPNPWQTASEFWAMAEAHVCLRGNFYAYKAGLPGRPPVALLPFRADRVLKVEQLADYTLQYHVRDANGQTRPIPGAEMLHLRGLTLDGITGLSPIEYAREAIGKGLASEQHLGRWFQNGLHPSAVIKHPLTLNAPNHAALRAALKEKYEGLGKSHEFMLLDEAMGIEFPQIKLVDAQFLEQMKLTEAQICGLFRVPLMLVQAGDKTPTYASAEQFMLAYSVYGVTPDCVNYEKAIRRDLLTPAERLRYFPKFNVNALLRGDFKTRMEGYQVAINCEVMSPNEARDLEEWNPYDGGDEYRTRTSTVRQPSPGDQGGPTP